MQAIWPDAFVEESNLSKKISSLRKMFDSNGGQFIETLPKHGYRFSADLRESPRSTPLPALMERRTVKRLIISHEEEESSGGFWSRYRTMVAAVFALVSIAAAGFVGFRTYSVSQKKAVDPYAAVRLTDDPAHDISPRCLLPSGLPGTLAYSNPKLL